MNLKLVNWNVEWAGATKREEIMRRVKTHAPDVVCLTEALTGLFPDGHSIYSEPDYGSGDMGRKRKVMLWSGEPWEQVDNLGSESMPPGRFVSGTTQTPLGPATVIGICIAPWHDSRARGQNAVRKRWEDHGQYIDALGPVLAQTLSNVSGNRLIVVGDFNQRFGQGTLCATQAPRVSSPSDTRAVDRCDLRSSGRPRAQRDRPYCIEPRPRRRVPRRDWQYVWKD